jgi:hypothetical protein
MEALKMATALGKQSGVKRSMNSSCPTVRLTTSCDGATLKATGQGIDPIGSQEDHPKAWDCLNAVGAQTGD